MWYFRLVFIARNQVYHLSGEVVPGKDPRILLGNLVDIYNTENRLSAYNLFHKEFGEIVQIFWLWRQQISISNYQMAYQVLIKNQKNYKKFPPNSLIQRLFGDSVLTNSGDNWKRHRLLMNEVFSKKRITTFHKIFVSYSEKLATKWDIHTTSSEPKVKFDIYPELLCLFLDIVGKVAIGHDFTALEGKADEFFENIQYIVNQSTRPVHQFTLWWKYLPLSSNHKLHKAFHAVDNFLSELILSRRKIHQQLNPCEYNLLDLLLKATDFVEDNMSPLTDKEVRDNLLAIIVNGHETVATSVSLSLYLLAQDPEKLANAQAEIDKVMGREEGQLTENGLLSLEYLDCVIKESLRLCPPMAGLQRISKNEDVLDGWSIPASQVVGISLIPLHLDSLYFGESPEQFCPERYMEKTQEAYNDAIASPQEASNKCPMKQLVSLGKDVWGENANNADIFEPLTFGDGARRCLGEHFAIYEMKVVLAILLYRFKFEVVPDFNPDLELGKFGLFISMFPKQGVEMLISRR
ncbi:cytochrome P450 [Mastigocoleus testarum]|uniref:cytochrome P450 n=1 Tax=Mastigocoleus testarum TaxID=996925 RepID=UPI001379DEF2|nr:cytochrome P450 [Mastigocoleus testarum]